MVGHVCVSAANRKCCHLKHPVVVSPKIVHTLWDRDAAAGTTANENDVQWCENCATKPLES